MTSISSAQFQELLKSGKIKPGKKGRLAFSGKAGAAIGHLLEQEHTSENDRALKRLKSKKVKIPKKEARQLSEIKMWLKAFGIDFTPELMFAKPRRFRFDIAIPSRMIAIEYEGIFCEKSRHTTVTGYSKDAEKYNLAVSLGWKVYRYTSLNYSTVLDLIKVLHEKESDKKISEEAGEEAKRPKPTRRAS
jgi:hypothetical protein